MPEMACLGGGLYTSNGQMPTDGCSVAEETMGTEPLGGFFRVSLDTHNHLVINQQGTFQSGYIYHNAVASRVDSSGDGSSMEEMLEGMSNIGDVEVSRSAVNLGGNNGGYTWTITFLRDKDSSGGRFGGCEQKDDKYGLCNSPGDVPMFCEDWKHQSRDFKKSQANGANCTVPDQALLLGTCREGLKENFNCSRITILEVDDIHTSTSVYPYYGLGDITPPGTVEKQVYYVRDPAYEDWDAVNSFWGCWTPDRDIFVAPWGRPR